MSIPAFRAYAPTDFERCMEIFDENCPEFFAPNERSEFADFLEASPRGYEVCELDGRVVGAFGVVADRSAEAGALGSELLHLRWIMIHPEAQGRGVGSAVMDRVERIADARPVRIAASHRSAPFFARFGAEELTTTEDGWGPGMHRVDMEWRS